MRGVKADIRLNLNAIRNVLHNPTYTGYLRSGDSRSPFIPKLQIISQEQFDRAQEILRQRADTLKNTPRVPLNMKGNALLSGNVFCGHCGARLHLSTANKCYTKADGTKVKKDHHDLAVCYAMKEEMCRLYELTDYQQSVTGWTKWFQASKESKIPALVRFAEQKEKRLSGLAAHAIYPISTGKLEGFNNKIKVAKRIGYGYRDDDFFFTLIRYLSIPSVHSSHKFP